MSEVDDLYPFDESLEKREHELSGLEKLRSFRDRELAAKAYEYWKNIQTRARRPEAPRPPPAREPVQQDLAVEEAAELERRYK